jgi:hypothetical protein
MSVAQPKSGTTKAGARTLTCPSAPGGANVVAIPGDIILHPSGAGWHVALRAFVLPVGGLTIGSDDNAHWSVGPSATGAGVPQSMPASSSFDAANTGIGTDGRAASSDGTIGGAVGVVSGGISGQSTTGAANTGGGGSPARGY